MLFKPRLPAFCCRKTHLIRLARTVTSMQQCHARVITGGHLLKGPGYRFENTPLSVSGDHFLQQRSDLQEEAFGNVSLIVLASHRAQLLEIVEHLEGNLTGNIYTDSVGLDDPLYEEVEPLLQAKVGRLLTNKMLFFSIRRRHTRLQGDWSSDVCSSDLSRAAWPHMRAAGYGRIVNITSAAMNGLRRLSLYGAGKGGVFGLTHTLAIEGADHGIRC